MATLCRHEIPSVSFQFGQYVRYFHACSLRSFFAPGRAGALRPLSPLRTVRDSFPSHGSSTSESPPVGVPTSPNGRLLHDTNRQSVEPKPGGAPARGPSIAFLPSTESIRFLVTRHQPKVSLLTEPGMLHPVSPPLQQGVRFLRLLDPDLQQLALRLACPKGEGPGVPRST